MFNFIRRVVVRFLTRKLKLVMNRHTEEHFIVSHISEDAYVILLTQYDTYLPVQYKVLKENFVNVVTIVDSRYDDVSILNVQDNVINLSSGESVKLIDINEPVTEESADFF